MKLCRQSGVLLHPTSLPGAGGIGCLGAEAYAFVDFLAETGQSVWQILPLSPTGYGDSPYSAFSAFAGNPLLVSLDRLVEAGDLDADDIAAISMPEGEAHFGFVHGLKGRLLHKAAQRFFSGGAPERRQAYGEFQLQQGYWLNDYALFRGLRQHFGDAPWNRWPVEVRQREPQALRHWGETLAEAISFHKYAQFVFFEQWFALKEYAGSQKIQILGDIPIYVAFDSVDVWANPGLFYLDRELQPTLVAGVPPDYFSATGQLWGNPMYRWERMAEQGFSWWLARFRWNLVQADLVRIDHFRGFEACWAVDAGEKTAINGSWLPVPGDRLFQTLQQALGQMPIVAEDLGLITPEVEALRDRFEFPGMKVLQFAFGSGPANPYLPHNLPPRSVVYTGTHDNDTTLGWWDALSRPEREAVREYLGSSGRDIPWELIRTAMASVSQLCIIPLQDLLSLGSEARMNTPGRPGQNWHWRFRPHALTPEIRQRLTRMTELYGRQRCR
ncbi:MAG: 4-alpha-glucanotransferase [Desulfuromonadales bacterium]|nr:4-alpha-glucanotransferase [Desulfuromonadales bacterium]